ncbi:MAG: TlpA disulfide reductase family protein [bacterium]
MKLLLALCLLVAGPALADPLKPGDALPVGTVALKGPDGVAIDPARLAGKVVLLDIWATWCEPCRASLPVYEALYKELGPAGFVVIAVSVDEHQDELVAFVKKSGLTFPIIWDPEGKWPAAIGLEAMPTALLVDRTGKVRSVHPGFTDTDGAAITAAARALVKAP